MTMIIISDDDLIGTPVIKRGSWMETVNEIHGIYPQRILTEPLGLELYITGPNTYGMGPKPPDYYEGYTAFDPSVTNVDKVDGGYNFFMVLLNDGTIWGTGSNNQGQLGLGFFDTSSPPYSPEALTQEVLGDTNWVNIWCGYHFAIALKSDGTLWSTGRNTFGMLGLGLGDRTDRHTFEQIGSATDWATAGAGWVNTYAINSSGELFSWGNNAQGQLGMGNIIEGYDGQCIPAQIGSATDWAFASPGSVHGLAIKTDGTLYGCGDNTSGQCGIGVWTHPITVFTEAVIDGSPAGAIFDSMFTFYSTSYGITKTGTVWSTGENSRGQCGIGDNGYVNINEYTQIGIRSDWDSMACGDQCTIMRDADGTFWALGIDSPRWTFGSTEYLASGIYSGGIYEPIEAEVGETFTNKFTMMNGSTLAMKF